MRELLRDYVLILANTGIRHGTSRRDLKWRNITTFEHSDGISYLEFHIQIGKTGQRDLVARRSLQAILKAYP